MPETTQPPLGLRTTIYKVSDLAAAKAWYTKTFSVPPYFDEPFYVGFNIGGYELGLMPANDTPTDEKTDNILSYWGVDNLDAAYTALIAAGATEHEAPHNVGGQIEVASVKDPWGNVIGIIYNPEFSLATGF